MTQVQGDTQTIKFTPVITNHASAHDSGDALGAVNELSNVTRPFSGALITDISITDLAKENTALELWIFDTDPTTGSTITDNTAISIAAGYSDNHRQTVKIQASDWVDCGAYSQATPASMSPFAVRGAGSDGTRIWVLSVCRGARNQDGVSDVVISMGVSKD